MKNTESPGSARVAVVEAAYDSVVRLFTDAGALVTVGDNCGVGGYGLNRRVAEKTGIIEAARGADKNVAGDTVMAKLGSG